ncbi:MAG TPA: nuclear transport factor 2 family protein [Thermodesulfobacteriota bacterium]|jgi:ketosteroid isomerase-like protein
MSESIVDHHLGAFGARDVNAILEDYTEGSVLIIPNSIIKGLKNIRGFFVNFTQNILPQGSKFELVEKVAIDNIAYLIWKAESDSYKIPFGTDTFIFEDGKIKVQTVALILEEKK